VIRPGFGGMQWAALLSVAAAILYAGYSIATRMAMRHDSAETTLFCANLVGAVIMLAVLPFVWTAPPSLLDMVLLLGVGAFGSLGHFLLILAHHRAPASTLSPFIYTQLVWASAFGYLVFAQVPSRWTLLGSAIVVASGLYLLNRERKAVARVAPREPG
jgi:drug/metabolite transporter (DMT)-like permease